MWLCVEERSPILDQDGGGCIFSCYCIGRYRFHVVAVLVVVVLLLSLSAVDAEFGIIKVTPGRSKEMGVQENITCHHL